MLCTLGRRADSDHGCAHVFFRDVLGVAHVDAGDGRLIFALPPAELGVHPADPSSSGRHELYLMCDDVEAAVAELTTRGVEFTAPVTDQGLYEPRHPTPL